MLIIYFYPIRTLISNINWTGYTPLDPKYLHITSKLELRDKYIPQAVTFWNVILPSLMKYSQESNKSVNQKQENNIIKLQQEVMFYYYMAIFSFAFCVVYVLGNLYLSFSSNPSADKLKSN